MISIKQTNITIMVNDIDKSITFYAEVLGFKLLKQYGSHYAQIEAPGITIGLHPSHQKKNTSENISIGFVVDNFVEAKEHLEELGIKYAERSEPGGSFIHFSDLDGTPLYFINS